MTEIKTEEEYEKSLIRIDEIFNPKTPEERKELKLLCDKVGRYEDIHYPIEEV